MADIPASTRNKHAHDPKNLQYGHYGAVEYDKTNEEWSILRHEGESKGAPLTLLHATSTSHSNRDEEEAVETSHEETVAPFDSGPLIDDLAPIIKHVTGDNRHYHANSVHSPICPVFCYAHSPYEQGEHRSLLPVVASVSRYGSILVRAVQMTYVTELDRRVPLLKMSGCNIFPPLPEPVLDLTCSPDKTKLSIRQRTATSFCSVVLSAGQGKSPGSTKFVLEDVISLPISRTGGHPHISVAFHPDSTDLIGVIDERGNWSLWRRAGRANLTTRILLSLRLEVSGKLLPTLPGHVPRSNPFLDGWHRICFVKDQRSASEAVLVCSRRVAKIYSLEGIFLADVDMRLGSRAANNEVLDLQSSNVDSSICYTLTTTRLMVMRLTKGGSNAETMEVICSWTHFCNRMSLGFGMRVIEDKNFKGVFLFNRGIRAKVFYWRNTNQSLMSCDDPQDLIISEFSINSLPSAAIALQLVELPGERKRRHAVEPEQLVKALALSHNGDVFDLTFSVNRIDDTEASITPSESCSLQIATAQDWQVRSSRVVDEDETLFDFVVPDDAAVQSAWIRPLSHAQNLIKKCLQPRNWSDLLGVDGMTPDEGTAAGSLSLLESQAAEYSAEQETLHSVVELVKDFRIADIEQLAKDVEEWQTRAMNDGLQDESKFFRPVVGMSTKTTAEIYRDLLVRFAEHMSRDLPDRARVQTERLARQISFDVFASGVVLSKPRTTLLNESSEIQRVNEEGEASAAAVLSNKQGIYAALRRYTTFNEPTKEVTSGNIATRILAHLPEGLNDPSTYSYSEIEQRIKEEESQQALSQLSDSERRRAERANQRKERRLAQQLRQRDAALTQSSYVPGVNMVSQQVDPREVQSSQVVPDLPSSSQAMGLPMTQPERGAHGERKKGMKKSLRRQKGF